VSCTYVFWCDVALLKTLDSARLLQELMHFEPGNKNKGIPLIDTGRTLNLLMLVAGSLLPRQIQT
jgi:hypothetical protein